MTSSNGNIFHVTGHLYGEFTGPRWIPAQRPVTRSFDVFFDLHLNKGLGKQAGEAGDLRRYRAHYDVIVMICGVLILSCSLIMTNLRYSTSNAQPSAPPQPIT